MPNAESVQNNVMKDSDVVQNNGVRQKTQEEWMKKRPSEGKKAKGDQVEKSHTWMSIN